MSNWDVLETRLHRQAQAIAAALKSLDKKCVFAESCTGGKMASAMTGVPGISQHFCGSIVSYREASKTAWLGISESELQQHTAESQQTTMTMAANVLQQTPEAYFSVAITGHLGPDVDDKIDGKIFVVIGRRDPAPIGMIVVDHQLTGVDRRERQTEAACLALEDFLLAIT